MDCENAEILLICIVAGSGRVMSEPPSMMDMEEGEVQHMETDSESTESRIRELESAIDRATAVIGATADQLVPLTDKHVVGEAPVQPAIPGAATPVPLPAGQQLPHDNTTLSLVPQASIGVPDGTTEMALKPITVNEQGATVAALPVPVPFPLPVATEGMSVPSSAVQQPPHTPTLFSGEGDNYHTNRQQRQQKYTISGVNGASFKVADNGAFYSEGTGRLTKTNLFQDITRKQNITATFESTVIRCSSCNNEHEIRGKMAVLLGDQGVPAIWPCAEDGKCIVIIRIEDGTLSELADIGIKLLSRRIAANSIIMLSAGSHLSAVGLSAYTSQLAEARLKLQAALQPGVRITHGPIFVTGYTKSLTWSGAVCNLMTWLISRHQLDPTGLYLVSIGKTNLNS